MYCQLYSSHSDPVFIRHNNLPFSADTPLLKHTKNDNPTRTSILAILNRAVSYFRSQHMIAYNKKEQLLRYIVTEAYLVRMTYRGTRQRCIITNHLSSSRSFSHIMTAAEAPEITYEKHIAVPHFQHLLEIENCFLAICLLWKH